MSPSSRSVRLNSDTGFIKLIACITMLCDHAGKMLFPQYPILRIIGRLAFPLFAYCMAVGCVYTRDMRRYVLRIALLALISQPFYVLGLGHVSAQMKAVSFAGEPLQAALRWYVLSWQSKPSILATLLAGMLLIWSLRERRYIATAALTLGVWWFQNYLDYGWRGIALMVLFYALCDRPLASFVWVSGFMAWWAIVQGGAYTLFGVRFSIQMFALMALPLIYLPTNTGLKLNKWVFYAFYPAHALLIYLACQLL